jgi:hypothetical protein
MSRRRCLIPLVLCCAVSAGFTGCGRGGSAAPFSSRKPGGYLISAFDRTGSTMRKEIRQRQLGELYELVDKCHVYKTQDTIWALDNKPVVIWDGGVPPDSDDDDFILNVKNELGLAEKDRAASRIARPGVMLSRINNNLSGTTPAQGPLVLFISTDGAMEDPQDNALFVHEAAVFVKQHPNAGIVVSGLQSQNRAPWERAFHSVDRDHRYFGSPTDQDGALQWVTRFMKGQNQ